MAKITETHLLALISDLNKTFAVKNPAANVVGTYLLESAHGGHKLERVSNTTGGTTDIFSVGFVSARMLYTLIYAYTEGVRDGRLIGQ